MKIVVFKSGMGNTLFQYARYLYLKKQNPTETFYAYLPSRGFTAHNGFELDKRFNVDMPKQTWWIDLVSYIIHNFNKLLAPHGKLFLEVDGRIKKSDTCWFQDGYWQDLTQFSPDFMVDFKLPKVMSDKNIEVIKQIQSSESIAVHVRRGDYLLPRYKDVLRILDMQSYYEPALEIVRKRFPNPKLFIFSDDIEWCKEQFKAYDCTFISWNKGVDSYLDMYLIALCQGVIIANSTFSFWGAWLNRNNPIVVMPYSWGIGNSNGETLYKEGWYRI